jgi:hypothetical protein
MYNTTDLLIAIEYLQGAKERISLATYRMETDSLVLDSEKNPIECALWDLMHQTRNVTEMLVKERFKILNSNKNEN